MKFVEGLLERYWRPLPTFARKTLIALGSAILVLVVVLVTQSGQSQQVSSSDWLSGANAFPTDSSTKAPQVPSATVLVQVVGVVKNPGVYSLPFGSRVLDAVFAAGGFSAGADQSSTNLARVVNDGEQISIASLTGERTNGLGVGSASKLVNLNLADASTLDTLPGIGPTLAQRIIDYRTANGGFRSISDLGRVAGIGASLMDKLKSLVSL